MFEAICSQTPEQRRITADEAYSKVFRLEDWGSVQVRDGWSCPECSQPVFLKGPHERIKKSHSYVVQAHFCHHSAAAAEKCELYKSGGSRIDSQVNTAYSSRMQSLTRFVSNVLERPGHLEDQLFAEEEVLLETASALGASPDHNFEGTGQLYFQVRSTCLSAARLLKTYAALDNFQIGILALGADQNEGLQSGYLAEKGRANCLRRLFIKFGKNRKHYFQALAKAGLLPMHDQVGERLIKILSKDNTASAARGLPPFSSLEILGSILLNARAINPGDLSLNHLQYVFSLPLLSDRISGFEKIELDHAALGDDDLQAESTKARSSLPPIRLTNRGKLLIESKPLRQMAEEGAEPNHPTSFILPESNPSDNCFLLIPGERCLLLTSSLHINPCGSNSAAPLSSEMLDSDPELPPMLWDQRICLLTPNFKNADIVIDRESFLSVINAMKNAFGDSCRIEKGGLKHRRTRSGLQITISS
ncbi:MAG: hypothetical protein KME02_14235 [Aphanothece saxicola GSE-SYN-MK-01-06B]|jgi:hypothetical protein|nr:hypothetical protein [Aphanothece saxicola GSE-SYN-MK-01-06B]